MFDEGNFLGALMVSIALASPSFGLLLAGPDARWRLRLLL